MNNSIEKLFASALAIEDKTALEREDLGFTARCMVLATLPHSKPVEQEYSRKSGNFTLTVLAPKAIGLPYGSLPRLLLCWLTTEAVRTKSRHITLGKSLSDFMRKLDLPVTGNSIKRLRQQSKSLFSSSFSCIYHDVSRDAGLNLFVTDSHDLYWNPIKDQDCLWESTITLSEKFFDEVTKSPIPLDLLALKALKKSPLAIDIYLWLTYRMSYLKEPCQIPWDSLQKQFGSEYDRDRAFKEAFIDAVRKVKVVYPSANITLNDEGVLLKVGMPSIPKKQLKKVLIA